MLPSSQCCQLRRLFCKDPGSAIGEGCAREQLSETSLSAERMSVSTHHHVDQQTPERKHEQEKQPGERRLRASVLKNEKGGYGKRIRPQQNRQHRGPRDAFDDLNSVHWFACLSRDQR